MDRMNEEIKNNESQEVTTEKGVKSRIQRLNGSSGTDKKKKTKIVIIVIVVLFLLLLGYRIVTNFVLDEEVTEESIVNVKTDVAKVGDIYLESPVTAKIEACDEVSIVPMVAGKVTSLNVEMGDYVSQGTVLFTIDDTQIQASIVQAREAYNLAKSTFERMQILYDEGVISQQDYESTRTQYITAEQAYNTASESASYYSVTTPISGYITALNVTKGGLASQSVAATVADVSRLVIKNSVSENIASKINVGDKVDVYISSLDKIFEGTVTMASKIPSSGTVTYPVEIAIADPNKELMAGMFAEVRIKSDHMESALMVPSEAVIIKGGESIVVTLDGNIPTFNAVQTGIDNGEYVEILSGISEGQTIVVSGQQYVVEGEEVRIVD